MGNPFETIKPQTAEDGKENSKHPFKPGDQVRLSEEKIKQLKEEGIADQLPSFEGVVSTANKDGSMFSVQFGYSVRLVGAEDLVSAGEESAARESKKDKYAIGDIIKGSDLNGKHLIAISRQDIPLYLEALKDMNIGYGIYNDSEGHHSTLALDYTPKNKDFDKLFDVAKKVRGKFWEFDSFKGDDAETQVEKIA